MNGESNPREYANIPTTVVEYSLPSDIPTMWRVIFIMIASWWVRLPYTPLILTGVSVDESGTRFSKWLVLR